MGTKGTASFVLKLIDRLSGPASQASAAIKRLSQQTSQFNQKQARPRLVRNAKGQFQRPVFKPPPGWQRQWDDMQKHGQGGGGGHGGFIQNMLGTASGFLLHDAIHGMAELGAEVAKTAFEYVTFGQTASLAFTQLTKHGVEPAKLIEHARALAEHFGLDLLQTTEAYQHFLQLQFSPKAADGMIRMGADMQALGASADEVQGIFLALGEMKSIGVLHQRQLLMLETRGISGELVRKALSEQMGKPVDQIQKLLFTGKVKAAEGIEAIEKAVQMKLQEAHLGDAGAKFANETINGIIGRFKAIGQGKLMDVFTQLTEPITNIAKEEFQRFNTFIESPKGAETIKAIGDALASAVPFAKDLAEAFGGGFSDTFDQLTDSAIAFNDAFGTGNSAQTAVELARSLGQVAAATVGFTAAFGALAAGVVTFVVSVKNAIGAVLEPIGTLIGKIESLGDSIHATLYGGSGSLGYGMNALGSSLMDGLGGGIDKNDGPEDAVRRAGRGIDGALRDELDTHSPSRVFADIGMQVSRGFALGIDAGAGLAASSSAQLGESASNGARSSGASYGGAAAASRGDFSLGGLTVNVNGGSDPEEIGHEVSRVVIREMEGFFRQLSAEGG